LKILSRELGVSSANFSAYAIQIALGFGQGNAGLQSP
jgi:hypothetical protein